MAHFYNRPDTQWKGALVERDLDKLTLGANGSVDISFAADKIPLQSEGSMSFVVVQAEMVRPDGFVLRTGTQPLYYRFRDGYTRIDLHHVDDVAALPNAGITVSDTMKVQGRVYGHDQLWHDVDSELSTSQPRLGLTGVRAISESEIAQDAAVDPPMSPLNASVKICSTWRVQYIDSNGTEDVFPTSTWFDAPARYAHAFVLSVPGNAMYWQGQLDATGCTPSVSLPAGTFRLQQSTTGIGYGGIYFNNYYMSGGTAYTYQVWADFSSSGSGTSTITVHPTFNNDAIQASAVASHEVYWHWVQQFFGGGGLGLVNGTYVVHANEGCAGYDPPTDSCYDPYMQLVHLGTTVVQGYGDAHWKYVIAHETGHMVAHRAMGLFYYDYNDSATQRLCKCNYDTSWGNTVHCLQSREQSGGAQEEGLGHAYASRVYNDPYQANGTFVYYKPFEYPAYNTTYPPVPKSAFNVQLWLESYCLATSRGVEFDWLTFEYNVGSWDRSNPTSIPQLFDIYRIACTGSSTTKCNNQTINWSNLLAAAATYYGPFDPRYERFRVTGQDFGVDH